MSVTPRLLISDIDGTLVDDRLTLDPDDIAAVQRARSAGTLVGLATGRMYRSAVPFAEQLQVDLPLICYQGAVVRERPGPDAPRSPRSGQPLGRLWREQGLEGPLALRVLALAEVHGWSCTAYQGDDLLVAREDASVAYYNRIARVPVTVVPDLRERLRAGTTKLVVVEPDPARFPAVMAAVRASVGAEGEVTQSYAGFCEVTAPGVTKGAALRWLCQRLGIALGDVVAVGDAPNDLSLLAAAGTAVAVRTAVPEVRAQADWIAPGPGQGGIAAVVEHFGLDRASAA